jgi:hypothetical protein
MALAAVAVGGYLILNNGSSGGPFGAAPTVTVTAPANGATAVPRDIHIVATFSKAMDPSTLNAATFTLKHNTTVTAGAVSYAGNSATLVPSSNLAAMTAYTATITTGAKDASGKALAADYAWSFATDASPDKIAPLVTFTFPAAGATDTAINVRVLATFTKGMDPSTLTAQTFTVKHGTTSVPGIVTYSGLTATFVPSVNLDATTSHTATITTGAKDTAGNALANNFVWRFSTGQTQDSVRPQVSSISPIGPVAVSSSLAAMFSEVMDPLTLTASTFTLAQGSTPVSGFVSYAGLTVTFDPASNFAPQTLYTATITTGAADLAGNTLAANFVWTFTTSQIPDTVAPIVVSTSPSGPVPVNSSIAVAFSEAMDPLTISASTFLVMQGSTSVPGLVSYAGVTATFDPLSDFAAGTAFSATLTTGAKDLAGNALQSDNVWRFTTSLVADIIAPIVSSSSPTGSGQIDINLTAVFNEAMDPTTITVATFLLKHGTTPVSGLVTYAGVTATFDPSSDLAAASTYTATITNGVKDLAGNALAADRVWNFSTGPVCDCGTPLVVSTSPTADFALDSNVTARFSEQMDATTVTDATFLVKQGTTPVSGLITYAGLNATFDPVSNLAANTTYQATLTTSIKDLAGTPLLTEFSWNFTTAATLSNPCAQLMVDLGSAAGFAVLAGSTVTNTGATTVTGDLGVSPGAAVTGFTPGILVGTQHAGDSVAADAIANVTTAYNDAAGRTLCPVAVAGNLGGMTLTPGLYKSTSSLEISSGDLTLDAQGDANAVFIFQIATTLDVSAGLHVILAGGAKASHIFWQVGTSATLGVNCVFIGTILADQSIAFGTGATLEGRALARIGAVTLDANTVTKPSD